MKKIVIIENHYIAPTTIRFDLVNALAKHNYEITILSKLDGGFLKEKFRSDIKFVDVGSSSLNPISAIKYCYNIYKAIKKVDPVVCLTFTIRPAIWGNIITRLLRVNTISTITGTGQLFENETVTYKIARWIYSWVLKKTKAVVFPNYDDLNTFIEKKFITKAQGVRVPGSGINFNNFLPQPKTRNLDGNFHFLYIGRLVKDKGIIEYIAAAKYFYLKKAPIVFHLVGMIWDMNEKKYGVTKEELQSWIDQKWIIHHNETLDVRDHIANIDCLVLPSYREGISNVLLEAASMQKPIVTTNVTGCRDVVQHNFNGLLCEAKNTEDLIVQLEKMSQLKKETLTEFGINGRKKVISEFAKEKVINKYIALIEKFARV